MNNRLAGVPGALAGIALLGTSLVVPACGGGESRNPASPARRTDKTSASATTTDKSSASASTSALRSTTAGKPPVRFGLDRRDNQGVINFPPRNEPNAFYQSLQGLYRDLLGRQQNSTSFVDPEGENVWLTEYFRFYLNGCSHEDSMTRTLAEIVSGGTQPVCGSERLVFPPRNLPNEFQGRLETTYRDVLRRPAGLYFVDTEGANVWLAQYLRFRVNGCDHLTAQNKVFMEIGGGGVQPVCVVSTTTTTSIPTTTTTSIPTTTTTSISLPPLTSSFTVGGSTNNCVVNIACAFDGSASTGSGTRTFNWVFGDNTTQTTTNPVFQKTYVCGVGSGTAVQITVRLNVTDTSGRPAATSQRTITVARPGCSG
jgi:hypothetical protein